jgi:hypothetical protein
VSINETLKDHRRCTVIDPPSRSKTGLSNKPLGFNAAELLIPQIYRNPDGCG